MGGELRALLYADAANVEKKAIDGQWSVGGIFLGFATDTVSLGIMIPAQKREGASVLLGELFLPFGSHALRVITLQRIRGNIEHFKSTNILWAILPLLSTPS